MILRVGCRVTWPLRDLSASAARRYQPMLRTGRWLAWLLHDGCAAEPDVPSRRSLTWNTRTVQQEQVGYYYSERGPGWVPCVEAWLHRIEVRRRFGPDLLLWRTRTTIQVPGSGPIMFKRSRSFGDAAAASREFQAAAAVRQHLAGEGRPWQEWAEVPR